MNQKEFKKNYIFITIIGILILFGFNGNLSTLGLDEAMYTTSSFEMVQTKDYLCPKFNYESFFDKPPMVYWMQGVTFDIFDKICGEKRLSDNSDKTKTILLNGKKFQVPNKIPFDSKLMLMRVPASLICLIFLWTIIFASKKLFGLKAGIYAGYAFLLCPLTAALGKMAIMDMILSFFIFLALIITLFVYLKKINLYYMVLAWISLGIAFMVKGPIALICVGLVYLVFLLFRKNIKHLFSIPNLIGFICFLGIIAPWFIKMQIASGGTFWYEFFIHQNFQRAAGQDFGHNYPIYSYIFIILLGMIPWSFYLIPSIIKFKFNNNNHVPETFLSVWVMVIFLFFTSLVGKLPGYIFPLFAPSAMLIGKFFAEFKICKSTKVWGLFATIFSVLLGLGFCVGLFLLNYQTLFAKVSMITSGLFMIILSIMAIIKLFKGKNPIDIYKYQMTGFLVFFVIGLFAITSNPCNSIDEIDSKYDLGTSSYCIAREFNIRNIPENVEIYAFDLSPLWISYPQNFERKVIFIDEEDVEDQCKNMPDRYFVIAKDDFPNIKGEKITKDIFTGKKHRYVFVKNY